MATMAELPYELLYQIILFLVQSPVGAADFARILSVCKSFLLFAGDERILKLVNFDIRMELKNFYRYQHINSLLVKCSEAGNVAAQFLLGKVILVSSSQLLLCEWQNAKCDFHPFDCAKLGEISCILATNVSAKEYYARFIGNDNTLINLIGLLVSRARRVRAVEKLAKSKESFIDSYRVLSVSLTPSKCCHSSNATSGKYIDDIADEVIFLLNLHKRECDTVGVHWRKAMSDMDYLEEQWNVMSKRLDEAYYKFNKIRAETVFLFDLCTQHVIRKM
ncbi:hypothetical protein POM88_050932 [Heracleum sosnowskyi]|uniref:F-box domain-containing protein n=1 Tax=Heracleum sosnowskyi TaxID=360622 RepID=A0AAD8M1Y5_9APIA|nr:hypothetical protein POM88_050932 [Heracleum sosnowskyi]